MTEKKITAKVNAERSGDFEILQHPAIKEALDTLTDRVNKQMMIIASLSESIRLLGDIEEIRQLEAKK